MGVVRPSPVGVRAPSSFGSMPLSMRAFVMMSGGLEVVAAPGRDAKLPARLRDMVGVGVVVAESIRCGAASLFAESLGTGGGGGVSAESTDDDVC